MTFNANAQMSRKEFVKGTNKHPLVGFKSSKPCVYIKYKGKPLKYNTIINAAKSKKITKKKKTVNQEKVTLKRAVHSFKLVWYKDKKGKNVGKKWFKKYYSETYKELKKDKHKMIPGNLIDNAYSEAVLDDATVVGELFDNESAMVDLKQKKNTWKAQLFVKNDGAVKFGNIIFHYDYKYPKDDGWEYENSILIRYKMKGFNKKLMTNNYLSKTQSSIAFVSMNRNKKISKNLTIKHNYASTKKNKKIEGANLNPIIRKREFKSSAKKKSLAYYKKHGKRWEYKMVFYDVTYSLGKIPALVVNAKHLYDYFYDYSNIYLNGKYLCKGCCKIQQEDAEDNPNVLYSSHPIMNDIARRTFIK